jgi:hypothetical protein
LIIASDDYVRKGLLVSWLQQLLVVMRRRHSEGQVTSGAGQHQQAAEAKAWNRLGAVAHQLVPHPHNCLPVTNMNQAMQEVTIECLFE